MAPLTIIVTRPEYEKADRYFDALQDVAVTVTEPDEASVAAAIRQAGAAAAILGVEPYTDELYRALPRCGIIARFGVGYDGIDIPKATAAGLLVTNTPGVLEDAVAEHTMVLMLGLYKNLRHFVASMEQNDWSPRPTLELRGKTLAVIGCGAIGRRVARTARFGFGMHVVGLDTRPMRADELRDSWGVDVLTDDFADAVRTADIVSLHVPSNEHTRHLICTATLEQMPAGSVLINTARGAVVDENALYDAVASGHLNGAALDVFEAEPYQPQDPARDLRSLPNVLLTPHVSSATVEACARVAAAAVDNVRRGRAGDWRAMSLLNPDVMSALND